VAGVPGCRDAAGADDGADREPAAHEAGEAAGPQALPKVFWPYVLAAGLLACGFVDFPLLSYHFQSESFSTGVQIPLLYAGRWGSTA
jgi:hypothetical protein